MGNYFFKITARAIVLGLFISLIQSCNNKGGARHGCSDPNFTATVNGNASFGACGAYAYPVMKAYAIIGKSNNDWITIGFLTNKQNTIAIGTYQVNNGATVPAGQPFAIDIVYKEGSSDLSHTYLSESGTIQLTEVSSKNYKGIFTASLKQMKGGSEMRTISATFNVNYK